MRADTGVRRALAAGILAVVASCRPAHVQTASLPVLDVESIERGAELAATKCSRCHGIGANDMSEHPSAPPFGTIADRYPLEFLQWTLEGGPRAGHMGMPAIELDGPELEDLKAYLRSLSSAGRTDAP